MPARPAGGAEVFCKGYPEGVQENLRKSRKRKTKAYTIVESHVSQQRLNMGHPLAYTIVEFHGSQQRRNMGHTIAYTIVESHVSQQTRTMGRPLACAIVESHVSQ